MPEAEAGCGVLKSPQNLLLSQVEEQRGFDINTLQWNVSPIVCQAPDKPYSPDLLSLLLQVGKA